MTDRDRSSGLERRAFLGGATSAGVASVLAPRAALGQASAPTAPSAPGPAITARTTEHLVGSAVNYAYAVKAGPFVFLNGHEGYDFTAGVVPAVAGAPGFPEYGKPGLRREADFIFERMGQILKSFGTDFAHSVRLDQYYHRGECGARLSPRALCRARQIRAAQHLDHHRPLLRRKEHHDDVAGRGMPDPQWEVKGVYPEGAARLGLLGLRARGGGERFRVRGGSGTRREGRARYRSAAGAAPSLGHPCCRSGARRNPP